MAETLTVYLSNKAGDLKGMFDATWHRACATALQGDFSTIIDGVTGTCDDKAGQPRPRDCACYLLTAAKESIAAGRATKDVTPGPCGFTLFSPLEQHTPNGSRQDRRGNAKPGAEWTVADCILHEPVHALLDANPPILAEVYKLKDAILRDTDTRARSNRLESIGRKVVL